MSVLNKLEIDVMQVNELGDASALAVKYNIPALVVHPAIAGEAHIARGRMQGRYDILTPIDWPKGESFGMSKLRGLSTDALEADGFEILLTPNKTEIETRNEIQALTKFIRNHLSEHVEIRYVLGTQSRDIEPLCRGILHTPTPDMIRNDIYLKTQVTKANAEVHNDTVEKIRSVIKAPIKICGNITNIKTLAACNNVDRFAVSLLQAKDIVKEFQQQPNEVRELLG